MSKYKKLIESNIEIYEALNRNKTKFAEELKRKYPKQIGATSIEGVRNGIKAYFLEKPLPEKEEAAIEPIDIGSVIVEERKTRALKAQVSDLKSRNEALLEALDQSEKNYDDLLRIKDPVDIISITPSGKTSLKKSRATPIILFSDWHLEENIERGIVNGYNEYNLKIAEQRVFSVVKNALKVIKKEAQDTNINEAIFWFGGDAISGFIHDELVQSNNLSPMEAIRMAKRLFIWSINHILAETNLKLIIPCSIGNHCISSDTEVLTSEGWIAAKDLSLNSKVASFIKETGEIQFGSIEEYKIFKEKGNYHVHSVWKDEIVTHGHNLVVNNDFIKAKDFKFAKSGEFRNAGWQQPSKGIDISDNYLRLLINCISDATIVDRRVKEKTNAVRIQFKLSKKRKIDRLTNLLDTLEIPYTVKECKKAGVNNLQPYYIRIYGNYAKDIFNYIGAKKIFPKQWAFEATQRQALIILDEIKMTDGRHNPKTDGLVEFSTSNRNYADSIQILCTLNNIPSKMKHNIGRTGGFDGSGNLYTLFCMVNGFNSIVKNRKVRNEYYDDIMEFCLIATHNGTLVTRRNGKVNFTGNSRSTKKMQMSTGYKNNYEYMMYMDLQDLYQTNKRVQFHVPISDDCYVEIYGKTNRFFHGDAVKYGGGIGGLSIPLTKYIMRKDAQTKADHTFMGHFHQLGYVHGVNCCVNGSLVGLSAYGYKAGFKPEIPAQAFTLLDEKRGYTVKVPIFAE